MKRTARKPGPAGWPAFLPLRYWCLLPAWPRPLWAVALAIMYAAMPARAQEYDLLTGPPRVLTPTRPGIVAPLSADPLPTTEMPLPDWARSWECIPTVIRTNGFESFRLEIDAPYISRVTVNSVSPNVIPPETPPFDLRDDGQGADLTANDHVYTAGPFRYNSVFPLRGNYMDDPDSPSGVDFAEFADITIYELDGSTSTFLVKPAIGLLRADIPSIRSGTFGNVVRVSKNLVNIFSGERFTQRVLRAIYGSPIELTQYFYQYLTDYADFLALVSTNHIEVTPASWRDNFYSGMHMIVKVNYTGTGWPVQDYSAFYYSAGRLLGLAFVDAGPRGLLSGNLVHELSHQWSGRVHPLIKEGDGGGGHYLPNTSVASLIGGHAWTSNGDGTWRLDCSEGRNGAHHASPLDKYLMGLIEPSQVLPIRVYNVYSPPPLKRCNQSFSDITATVTIADIQAYAGPRSPGPATAPRTYSVAFVCESHREMFNDTEMTFYNIFAEHFGKQIPAGAPDPYVGGNWVPVSRFFGEGTTWNTQVRLSYDLDHDGDVDKDDAAILRACSRGSDVVVWDQACQNADFDRDGDVDLEDFAGMQRCMSGPGIPADPTCGPP